MKRLIPIVIPFILMQGTAMAESSIIDIKAPEIDAGAILEFHCKTCPPEKDNSEQNQPAVQVMETSIDGDRKAVQLDNMMGGSHVRTVRDLADPDPALNPPVVVQATTGSDSEVTFSGGGDFDVERVGPPGSEGSVDESSQTSSVNMENAEHDNVDGPTGSGPEILELRPGTTVVPQDQ